MPAAHPSQMNAFSVAEIIGLWAGGWGLGAGWDCWDVLVWFSWHHLRSIFWSTIETQFAFFVFSWVFFSAETPKHFVGLCAVQGRG
jgi:hypothetical protein